MGLYDSNNQLNLAANPAPAPAPKPVEPKIDNTAIAKKVYNMNSGNSLIATATSGDNSTNSASMFGGDNSNSTMPLTSGDNSTNQKPYGSGGVNWGALTPTPNDTTNYKLTWPSLDSSQGTKPDMNAIQNNITNRMKQRSATPEFNAAIQKNKAENPDTQGPSANPANPDTQGPSTNPANTDTQGPSANPDTQVSGEMTVSGVDAKGNPLAPQTYRPPVAQGATSGGTTSVLSPEASDALLGTHFAPANSDLSTASGRMDTYDRLKNQMIAANGGKPLTDQQDTQLWKNIQNKAAEVTGGAPGAGGAGGNTGGHLGFAMPTTKNPFAMLVGLGAGVGAVAQQRNANMIDLSRQKMALDQQYKLGELGVKQQEARKPIVSWGTAFDPLTGKPIGEGSAATARTKNSDNRSISNAEKQQIQRATIIQKQLQAEQNAVKNGTGNPIKVTQLQKQLENALIPNDTIKDTPAGKVIMQNGQWEPYPESGLPKDDGENNG